MFALDIETLATESTAVILSAAVIHFDYNEDFSYTDLLNRAVFVKFKVKEQVQTYDRIIETSTLSWWEKQGEVQKKKSFYPASDDLSVVDGYAILKEYFEKHSPKNDGAIWIRGSLDQVCIDSLAKAAKIPELAYFNRYRDARTAIDLLKDTSNGTGYCTVPNFDKEVVIKHDPVHDCAYDIMMIRYGE